MKTRLIYSLACCVLGLSTSFTNAADIYVDCNVSSGTNDGTSWATAYSTLADAVADANSNGLNDKIRIRSGIYAPTGVLSITEPCVLIGEAGTTIHAPSLSTALMRMFEIDSTHAHFRNIVFYGNKSFIYSYLSELLFHDCQFLGNTSTYCVGTDVSGVRFHNCQFRKNQVSRAVLCNQGFVELHNCLFEDNHGSYGVCLSASSCSHVEVLDCQFSGNHSRTWGGAIYINRTSETTIARCLFKSNEAEEGGAIYFLGIHDHLKQRAYLVNCVFRDNRASVRGGGIRCDQAAVRLSNCTLIENHAQEVAGGIHVEGTHSHLAIENSILWGNRDRMSFLLAHQQVNRVPDRIIHCCVEDPAGLMSAWGRGVINQNPGLQPNGKLQIGSPCIDAGDSLYYPDALLGENLFSRHNSGQDLAGNDRLIGLEIDMGAFEKSLFDSTPLDSSW